MTADPTTPCAACSNAAAIWEAAADRYDPDAERVTSRRPA